MHRGGVAEPVELDETYRETAVRAAQIMGLRVAGVDLLEADDGPQIMEVNSSPGLEGIESATKLDVAGAIVDYIANQINFPEIDIRQRLTVSKGFGVAELLIPEGTELVGKTIAETGLRDRDVMILNLHRGTSVISIPKNTRVLEADDRLLCYGRLDDMRHLTPAKRKRKKKLKAAKLDPDRIAELGDTE
ncbi:MAG: hypothetical protein F6K11_21975 [Leptolyngbya sp. SIO3F4]|nr:hypothetical protein [Leptolyngbya sp. SIO3F4]